MDCKFFQALSEEIRLKIISLLASGQINVTDLTRRIGSPQPTVSRHLKVLSDSGLVRSTRRGKEVYYEITPSRLKEAWDFIGNLLGKTNAGARREGQMERIRRKPIPKKTARTAKVPTYPLDDWEEKQAAPSKPSDMDDFLL